MRHVPFSPNPIGAPERDQILTPISPISTGWSRSLPCPSMMLAERITVSVASRAMEDLIFRWLARMRWSVSSLTLSVRACPAGLVELQAASYSASSPLGFGLEAGRPNPKQAVCRWRLSGSPTW
jgi:hypothetical protein